jgi:hypothetical protein
MEHYFCYSYSLQQYLKERGFKYICIGLNPDHGRKFWLYQRDNALSAALEEYSLQKTVRGSCSFWSKTGCAKT